MAKMIVVRRALAAVMLLATSACFLDFTGFAAKWFGWSLHLQLIPAALCFIGLPVALVALTALFGRTYCSVACPLGILQDLAIWVRRKCGGKFAAHGFGKAGVVQTVVRWAFLAIFLAGGFLGLHFTWLEPYGIYGRFMSAGAAPAWRAGNNLLAEWAANRGSYLFHGVEVVMPPLCMAAIGLGTAALILALAAWKGRVWCNWVCPVGTALGVVARFAPFRARIDDKKCVQCGACERVCKACCADSKAKKIDATRCVGCFNCAKVCRKEAVKWAK